MKNEAGLFVALAIVLIGCGASPEYANEPDPIEAELVPPPPWQHEASLLGRWGGLGSQSDGGSWTVAVAINNLRIGRCAEVAYPSAGCRGWWECAVPSDGLRLDALEHISEGRDTCVDGAHVQAALARNGRRLMIFAEADGVTAAAALVPTY